MEASPSLYLKLKRFNLFSSEAPTEAFGMIFEINDGELEVILLTA